MAALPQLIEQAIPEARQNLENSYNNLERVAAYCEANYLQATDKRAAVEETKRYAVQSLASVAYQINMLASNLLRMLDLQTENIVDMESQVSNIAQIVNIHKEKVERREIGVLTANKNVIRQHKIIAPSHQEKPQKYVRRPIDYSILDDIGHGVKLQQIQNPRLLARTGSTVSACSSNSGGAQMAPPPPPLGGGPQQVEYVSSGSMRFGQMSKGNPSREYRAPITIAPPTAPAFQGPEYVTQRYPGLVQTNQVYVKSTPSSAATSRVGSYSAVSVSGRVSMQTDPYSGEVIAAPMSVIGGPPPPPPPMQQAQMMALQQQQSMGRYGQMAQQGGHHDVYQYGGDDYFAPPPAPEDIYADQNSPLPPPPPEEYHQHHRSGHSYGEMSSRAQKEIGLPDWVPSNYVEKVIAIYDYQAQKSDELSFQENSVIYVLKKNDDGWYEGVLHGVTGLFPGNYVESCM